MTGYTALLMLCIVLRALFVASLFSGSQRMARMLYIGVAWACADIAIVLLSQAVAWRAAAQAFVTILALGWM